MGEEAPECLVDCNEISHFGCDSESQGYNTATILNEKIVDTPFVKAQKKILGTEVVVWSKGVLGDRAMPIVISGPSGVGKGTLISRVMKEFPTAFGFSVSHTTRSPRTKEVDGVHYHFTKRSTMENDIRDGKFLEYASVHGNLYGTSIEAVEAVTSAGKGNGDRGADPKETAKCESRA